MNYSLSLRAYSITDKFSTSHAFYLEVKIVGVAFVSDSIYIELVEVTVLT